MLHSQIDSEEASLSTRIIVVTRSDRLAIMSSKRASGIICPSGDLIASTIEANGFYWPTRPHSALVSAIFS